jgi:penicillin G amidase
MRIFPRAVIWLGMTILVLAGSLAAWLYWRSRACLPQLDGTLRVPGLLNAVEVLRDARGVPHLRAQSLEDLLFAQGYVTAQDRLWQMDMSRRYAQGELAEIFGESGLRLDIENRRLGLRQAIERALEEIDPESRKALATYARGVNAFMDTYRGRLPIEFWILHYQPRP